jgi:hypothetical protein
MAGSSHEKDVVPSEPGAVPNDPVPEINSETQPPPEPFFEERDTVGPNEPVYDEKEGIKGGKEVKSDHGLDVEPEAEGNRRAPIDRTKSYATDASVATSAATSRHPERDSKPWYKTPNPLKWGKIPPIPQEKDICPEYHASFLSKLVFHWMAPLMRVRKMYPESFVGQANFSLDWL